MLLALISDIKINVIHFITLFLTCDINWNGNKNFFSGLMHITNVYERNYEDFDN